ncbi:MAG: ABC transporter ATP-binding protein [Planctomycetaceae bacterium]|nr:ABC transporter ATP-binding protein [Planctomycetaceae bacterium]
MPQSKTHLSAVAIDKAYLKGAHRIPVLRGVDVSVAAGEFISIVGQSGSGKSTLMHLLGLLDAPDMGEVRLNGDRIDNLPARVRDDLRNNVFGFVFQFYHLLPELTLVENVLAPLMIRHGVFSYWGKKNAFLEQAQEILDRVGLGHRLHHRPSELSGGEMQRAAIARALMNQPEVLLADEPTGNLDSHTGGEILDLLCSLNEDEGLTIIMVTHDDYIAQQSQRIVRLTEGRIQELEEAA